MTISRVCDAASAQILALMLQRRCINEVQIARLDNNRVVTRFTLTYVLVSGFSVSVGDSYRKRQKKSEEKMTQTESISFNFQRISLSSTTYILEPLAIPVGLSLPEAVSENADESITRWAKLADSVVVNILENLSSHDLAQFGFCCKFFAHLASNEALLRFEENLVRYNLHNQDIEYNGAPAVDYKGRSIVTDND